MTFSVFTLLPAWEDLSARRGDSPLDFEIRSVNTVITQISPSVSPLAQRPVKTLVSFRIHGDSFYVGNSINANNEVGGSNSNGKESFGLER